jgi:hypothetical protein
VVSVPPLPSLTATSTVNVPAALGLPVKSPAGLRATPPGSVPEVTVKVSGSPLGSVASSRAGVLPGCTVCARLVAAPV